MKILPAQWVVAKLFPNAEKGKPDKIPVDPLTGAKINPHLPGNWLTYETAKMWAASLGPDHGTGWVVTADSGIFFLDLDHCRYANGGWAPYVASFMARFPAAYSETSVSGDGKHLLIPYRGTLPRHSTRNSDYGIEGYSHSRFVWITEAETTGARFTGHDYTAELVDFLEEFFPEKPHVVLGEWRDCPVPQWSGPDDDEELIRRARQSQSVASLIGRGCTFNDLWTADADMLGRCYPSSTGQAWDGSAVDLAFANHLAFWTGANPERMLRIMLSCDALTRPKWDREKYLRDTILNACTTQKEWYKGPAETQVGVASSDAHATLPAYAPPSMAGEGLSQYLDNAATSGSPVPPPPPPPYTFDGSVVEVYAPNTGLEGAHEAAVSAPKSAIVPPAPPVPTPGVLPHRPSLDSKNRFEACLPNLRNTFATSFEFEFAYDDFLAEVVTSPRGQTAWTPVTDVDYIKTRDLLESRYGYASIGKEMIRDAILYHAHNNRIDSAKIWLNGLVWDGKPRVKHFLSGYCGAEGSAYTQAVSHYIWSGLAARVFEPGCQLDMVVAFQSAQGRMKSSGLRAFVPDPMYFSDGLRLNRDDDNFKRLLKGKLVVEIAELAGMRNAEVEQIKAMITRREEEWIEKYQTARTHYGRRCMLFATVNPKDFLPHDDTGHRRWLPVPLVYKFDRESIARDRDQLWAEGAVMYRERVAAGLPGVAFELAEQLAPQQHQNHLEEEDAWLEIIQHWLLAVPYNPDPKALAAPPPICRPFSVNEVIFGALKTTSDRVDMRTTRRVTRLLKKLGCEAGVFRVGLSTQRLWFKSA